MKITTILIFLLAFSGSQTFGQKEVTTVYKNLDKKKHYSVQLSYESSNNKSVYKVNDKRVNKTTYNKYKRAWDNMVNCTPCILETYDIHEVLLSKREAYQDCGVGWYKTYFANGNVQVSGHFKENPTGDWSNLWNRKYCNIKHGEWTYFNEDGDTLYSDFWEEGQFIKQVPEQNTVDIWDVEYYLNNIKIDTQKIAFKDINNIAIRPKYKNSQQASDFIIKASVSLVGYIGVKEEFTMDTFTEANVKKMFDEAGVLPYARNRLEISVYLGDKYLDAFVLHLKE